MKAFEERFEERLHAAHSSQPILPCDAAPPAADFQLNDEVIGDHAAIVQQLAHEILHADPTKTTKPDFVRTLQGYIALQPAHATAPPATAHAAQPDWRCPEEVTAYLENMPLEWQLLWAAVHKGSTERVGLVVLLTTYFFSRLPPSPSAPPSTKLLVIFLARCMSYLTAAPPLFFSSDSLHSALERVHLQIG